MIETIEFSNLKVLRVLRILLLVVFLFKLVSTMPADDISKPVRPKDVVIIDYTLNATMKYEFIYDESNRIISIKRIISNCEDYIQQYITVNYRNNIVNEIRFDFGNAVVQISQKSSSENGLRYMARTIQSSGEYSESEVLEINKFFELITERWAQSIDLVQYEKLYQLFTNGNEMQESYYLYPDFSKRDFGASVELIHNDSVYGIIVKEENELRTDILIKKMMDSSLVNEFRITINYESGETNYMIVFNY